MFTTIICISSSIFCRGGVSEVPPEESPALYTGRRGTIKFPTEICTGSPF